MNAKALIKNKPQQGRAQVTLNRILDAAQDLLVEGGFEALNSNAIVERLGMTPPTFYRYFKNKHDLLRVLCQNLMEAQNDLFENEQVWEVVAQGNLRQSARNTTEGTLKVTKEFKGGHVLLQLLRAIPELQPIRMESHDAMAKVIAEHMLENFPKATKQQLVTRARLSIEMGYSVVEMLFETNFKNQDEVIDRMSAAMETVYADVI